MSASACSSRSAALALLVEGATGFVRSLTGVSFREHALVPEPCLVVGLIVATRRVLVVTAEFGDLTGLIVALVASLVLLRRSPLAVADRS
ncbi:MAG TPA: hypothetical protein VGU22_18150 [Methylomirabilota bacterium]|jgi:hypothetical protein|nr:hypothetical protein [Methylomirabilota bacterium]